MKGSKWLTVVDSFFQICKYNSIRNPDYSRFKISYNITEHIRQFGRPQTIICDQEPAFISIDFVGFLNDLGIEIHHASNSNPKGIVERFHSTLIELYRTMKSQHNNLPLNDQLNILTDSYNNTFHIATKRNHAISCLIYQIQPIQRKLQKTSTNFKAR